ncbi:DUF7079 family protein [Brevundimonas subvibrioides]|uniref:DUF7079 family protein n=1 Tax=Brevundimonas subvibrioides TaxID=74313 RepID=UPI0012EA4F7F|nr:hypothetical protein [Brevundimonas subvibrioides]
MGEPLSPEETARRAPLWVALSDLFLDTEIQAVHYEGILKAARSGGFEPNEVIGILNEEVAPVLGFNLMQIAGEWAMFDPDWVVSRVSARLATKPARHLLKLRRWPELERVLKGDSIEQVLAAEGGRKTPNAHLVWWVLAAALIAVVAWHL